MAALVPSDYRGEFLQRASSLHTVPVAQHVSEYERARVVKLEASKSMPANNELGTALRVVMDRRGSGQNGALLVRDLNVPLKEYKAWQEALRSLDQMEAAVKRYSYADGRFTPTNIIRAGKAVAGVSLTPTMVWAIFSLFDKDGSGELHYDQFVRLLRPKKNINPRTEEEGLGLGGLLACVYGHCRICVRNWYDGTIE